MKGELIMIEETNLLVDRKSAIDAVRYLLMGEKYFSGIGGASKDLVRARELFDKAIKRRCLI